MGNRRIYPMIVWKSTLVVGEMYCKGCERVVDLRVGDIKRYGERWDMCERCGGYSTKWTNSYYDREKVDGSIFVVDNVEVERR